MGLHVYWPATACVTLFVVGVIIVLLRYGPKYCKTRHVAYSDEPREYAHPRDANYDHSVSDA